jgi:plasmid stabilization system protein ParE
MTFQPEARVEFLEAIAWYEERQTGLGLQFAEEVIRTLRRAQKQPEIFPRARRARKIRLKRFKFYNIYFTGKEETFSVLAIFHSSRNPEHLAPRLNE